MSFPSLKTLLKQLCYLSGAALLVSCASNQYTFTQSANYSHRVKFLVMHYTAIDYEKSMRALVDEGGLSSHYLLPESGDSSYPHDKLEIIQLVDENDRAWHAGRSYWQGREDLNDHSIGIEIVNVPTCHIPEHSSPAMQNDASKLCIYPDYDAKQIELLITLSKDILKRNPDIGPTQIVGHSDIAPSRKNDPGPRFPWYQLYKAGIGAWYDSDTVDKYWQLFSASKPSTELMQKAMRSYGYEVIATGQLDSQTLDALSAFQMHFLPWHVSGNNDARSAAVLFALLEKYFPKKSERLFKEYQQQQLATEPETTVLANAQVVVRIPSLDPSSRELVNNRGTFQAYKGRGEIIIENHDARSADIYINGEKINIASPLTAEKVYQYSLAKRTHNGINTFKVDNVQPEGASLTLRFPYPTLIKNTHKDRFKAVDELINQEVAAGFPGAVLGVIKEGELIKLSHYGAAKKYHADGTLLASPEAMKNDTLFDIASNSKMFATNFALMKLASEGKLDVEKPLFYYLPEFRGSGREQRLVKDLLTHSAGYPAVVDFHRKDNKFGERFFSQNSLRTKNLLLTGVPFVAGRNVKHLYSDIDYMLLGVLIERISGMPLDSYVESQLYQPLGLTHTVYNPLQKGFLASQIAATEINGNTRGGRIEFDNIRTDVLQGEVHDEKAFYALGGVAGHAGLFSTAGDIMVLMQVLLNGGGYDNKQLFTPQVLAQFTQPQASDETYGLGWRRAGHQARTWHFGPYASPRAYGHTGWTGTVTVIDPEYDLAIVLLTNARHTPIEGNDKSYEFVGKRFETGKYGSIISLIYESILNH
ncbi:penicillin binding protein PBP4B [Pseudoalteromonas lipolytica]|uniref:Penicillin binding protein PBP4B n=1 Tax=Pseudoalteromonas lipolytica TaxID=570156 RepID=A0AAD0WBR7_9GAMM|nr:MULTISPECIES: penicillin binding protein PBP4B [Pseudoalteromonas]AXV64539.1 penicillin binding protein PBP4B [Pseudoalteromonas donghaensis]QLJ09023.1 penicillin binding protein PBP4B [Pseudoalteromonas sp. JSTW]